MSTPTLREQGDIAHAWWRTLQPLDIEGGRKLPGDRATLARLRRCSSPHEAVAEPATGKLFRNLGFDRRHETKFGRVGALAAVLAHVRDEPTPLTRIGIAVGAPPGAESADAIVKPTRFKHLVSARGDEEVMIAFRRVVALLDRTANVRDLTRLILSWTDDEAGDRTRTRFAFDYHGAGFAAPGSDDTHSVTTATPEKV